MESRPNKNYERGCTHRDGVVGEINLEKAIAFFAKSKSFAGYYAIGELYKYGVSYSSNGQNVFLDKDSGIAASYFLKAYKANAQNTFLIVNVYGSKDLQIPVLHDLAELSDIHELIEKSRRGNPESLYQLAIFYIKELEYYGNAGKRKIAATESQLKQWIKACLTASAKQYHPHAAYELATTHKNDLTADELLEYSFIAADPIAAMDSQEHKTLLHYRGDTPLQNPLLLFPYEGMPEALRSQTSVNNSAKIAGIHANSVVNMGDCILPEKHAAFVDMKANTVGSNSNVVQSQDELRKLRLARFGNNAMFPVNNSTKTPDASGENKSAFTIK